MKNKGLDNLLDLNDTIIGLEDDHWVKFSVWVIAKNKKRPHNIRYSLTLHDKSGVRLLGFDNAHEISYGKTNKFSPPKRQYDHWHSNPEDEGQPYSFIDAYTLLSDFWEQVDQYFKYS